MSSSFPLRLLDGSDDERLRYFAESSIKHPRLTQATRQLRRAMNSRVVDSIIFVYGPPGVGKTTLCEHLVAEIIKANSACLGTERYREVPIAFINAAAPDNNHFDWKYFYQHAIFNIESSVSKKRPLKLVPYNPRLAPALYFSQKLKTCEYRNHFIASLRKYLPLGFFIDEAQHLAKVKSADQLRNQMDIIKTIAHFSRIKIILTGSYDILPFRNLSGQLSRRSWDVHLSRYTTSPEDLNDFQSAILSLQKRLPLPVEPNLVQHWKYIYTKSAGCVGIMKDWLLRALEIAIDDNKNTLSLEMLEECALSDNQSLNIALEISSGEQLTDSTEKSYQEIEQALGFLPKKNKKTKSSEKSASSLSPMTAPSRPGKKFGVGRPKAKRFPTGK